MQKKVDSKRVKFKKSMKKDYTVFLPMMLPIHFNLIQGVLNSCGYNTVLLKNENANIISCGLKYVHNDTCYPAILVIGQFIDALNSGLYDTNKIALMITQTGGGCRASNYIHLLRKALKKAGFAHVPVISLNLSGLEKNSGFKLSLHLLKKMIFCLVYGDVLMYLKNKIEPYEILPKETSCINDHWQKEILKQIYKNEGFTLKELRKNVENITTDFANIKTDKSVTKIKVGVVGEIYVKYSSLANNNLESFLKQADCEVCTPGILNFMLFKIDNRLEDIKLYGGSKTKKSILLLLMRYIENIEKIMLESIKKSKTIEAPSSYQQTKKMVEGIIGYGNKMGEGWLLTAEMLELCKIGYANIVCTQPFGCLPNHICAKGMIRKIREIEPKANIVCIDYDPGASKVNQENRIKLMLSIAKENL